ncbi:transmembrane amino acid transporter protein (macronuclear) [Tetrahymena thermophila SB210]|uniref:Transmembrane amino acid transporter protein n=1 Tax=Tetrahymena thermophila (strain SB210) TaxID=312017 RepID=I7MLY3_TETTS|nr:transmembrane amino acid transporter protein [Tetrahymena thermophila SB210]EAS03287.1 transmembrane amino acid transporter protein [Tetrahymena thermophila SB210]|eukprot:XP_001023532.1 transmembrane amino acid transporter protein [Tetrahymena thermophila SB210]
MTEMQKPTQLSQDTNSQNQALSDNKQEYVTPSSDVVVKEEGASILNATANICKTGLGLGMLFMPLIFSKTGVYIPILCLVFFGILCFYCWNLLGIVLRHVSQSEKYNKTQLYQEYKDILILENTLAIVFSPGWKIFCQIINGLNMYGGCLGYVIFITQSFEPYISNYILRICIIVAIYLPLCFLKDIKAYGKFSSIALTIYTIVVLTIIGKSLDVIRKDEYPDEPIILNGWNTILEYIGIFILAYDVNGTVGLVHASMREKKRFFIPLSIYIIFACCVGTILGLCGYFAYRDQIGDIIFKNIGSLNGGGDALLFFYCFTLIMSICLYGFVLTRMIDTAIWKKDENTIRQTVSIFYRFPIRIAFIGSLALLAYVYPSASNLFSLLGCIFGVILTYILPCILYEKIFFGTKMSKIRVCNYIVMAIGAAGGIAGFVYSLKDLINSYQ